MATVLVVIVIALIAGLVWYVQRRLVRKRREALQSWARSRGLSFIGQDDSYTGRFRGGPFGKGEKRRAVNVITGSYDEHAIIAFDYSYVTESTDSKGHRTETTHRFSVAALNLPSVLPDLEVGREGFFSSIGRALGFHDIEFENEAFNKQFKVHAQDRKFAYDIMHPRMMEWMMQTPGPSWCIERADVLCWASGTATPAEVDAHLSYLTAVVQQIPGFVWDRPSAP